MAKPTTQSSAKLFGSGVTTPSTGVLKVSAKAGSFRLLASIPMQYCPGARLATEIVLVKLSPLFSVAVPPLLQPPTAPSENK